MSRLTGYSKTVNSKFEPIRNYQVSHVFGRTKNIYAFTAPWNIVYMPKLLDPFTGHEATGSMVSEFTLLFQRQSYALFGKLIDDFNELISCPKFLARMSACMGELQGDQTIEQSDFRKFEQAVKEEFRPIVIA
ncbi:MAG: hypothetical protein HQ492_07630 [Woeseiaceae bacterium]|nr:hypothetical protein [Woeseiaceae bacterium]